MTARISRAKKEYECHCGKIIHRGELYLRRTGWSPRGNPYTVRICSECAERQELWWEPYEIWKRDHPKIPQLNLNGEQLRLPRVTRKAGD